MGLKTNSRNSGMLLKKPHKIYLSKLDSCLQHRVDLANELTFLWCRLLKQTEVTRTGEGEPKVVNPVSDAPPQTSPLLICLHKKRYTSHWILLIFSYTQALSWFPIPEEPDWSSQRWTNRHYKDCHYKFLFVQEVCLIEGRPQQT